VRLFGQSQELSRVEMTEVVAQGLFDHQALVLIDPSGSVTRFAVSDTKLKIID